MIATRIIKVKSIENEEKEMAKTMIKMIITAVIVTIIMIIIMIIRVKFGNHIKI